MTYPLIGLGNLNNMRRVFSTLHNRGLKNVQDLKALLNKPTYDREPKKYSISEVARLIDVSRVTIRDHEKNSKIQYSSGNSTIVEEPKKEYRLSDVNILREYFHKGFFNGSIHRPSSLDPLIISLAMFKGGVGKTTHSSHLAAYCAIKGLKTLLIDLDPQASATLTLGYIPSVDLEDGNTIYNALLNNPEDIFNIIRPTHYDGLDIVTSGLELQGADLTLPNSDYNNSHELGSPLFRLKKILSQKEIRKYDVIILDLAPNHASVTMNALVASNGIILPINPTMLAYGSSIQFDQTLGELSDTLIRHIESIKRSGDPHNELKYCETVENLLFRVLITDDHMNGESKAASDAIRDLYAGFVLPRTMLHTIALPRSSNDLSLLYDMRRSEIRGTKEAYDRGIISMNMVHDDILDLFKNIWGINS